VGLFITVGVRAEDNDAAPRRSHARVYDQRTK
jgi:hypothetical protein